MRQQGRFSASSAARTDRRSGFLKPATEKIPGDAARGFIELTGSDRSENGAHRRPQCTRRVGLGSDDSSPLEKTPLLPTDITSENNFAKAFGELRTVILKEELFDWHWLYTMVSVIRFYKSLKNEFWAAWILPERHTRSLVGKIAFWCLRVCFVRVIGISVGENLNLWFSWFKKYTCLKLQGSWIYHV